MLQYFRSFQRDGRTELSQFARSLCHAASRRHGVIGT
jgi:hypothetical protein